MQEKLNIRTVNKALVRILVISAIVFTGMIYQIYASNITGSSGLTISGNLYVTSTLTVGGNEGATAPGALIMWDGTACPTGWTDVSASYADRFPLGGTTLLNSGSNSHSHSASDTHGSTFSTNTLTHDHTFGGNDDTQSHSHTATGCTLQGESVIGNCYTAAGSSSSSEGHDHGGYSGDTDAADSHSHSVSGTTYSANQGSSTDSHIPLYRTLKLCKKA